MAGARGLALWLARARRYRLAAVGPQFVPGLGFVAWLVLGVIIRHQ